MIFALSTTFDECRSYVPICDLCTECGVPMLKFLFNVIIILVWVKYLLHIILNIKYKC